MEVHNLKDLMGLVAKSNVNVFGTVELTYHNVPDIKHLRESKRTEQASKRTKQKKWQRPVNGPFQMNIRQARSQR